MATPAPRATSQIHEDVEKRFAGVIKIIPDSERDDIEYLTDCDHYEVYSETKQYSKRPYNLGSKEYISFLVVLDRIGDRRFYVVGKRMLTEYDKLADYCPCLHCKPFGLIKYLKCSVCTGCVKAGPGYCRKEILTQARYRANHKIGKYKLTLENYWLFLLQLVIFLLLFWYIR